MISRRWYSKVIVIILVFAFCLISFASISCGKKSKTGKTESGAREEGSKVVDYAIKELDTQMNQINPSDFEDAPLNEL